MTLSELRRFIADSRDTEGVNWYLFDATPVFEESGCAFALFCYDDAGQLIRQVSDIAEHAGGIPADILLAIADARAVAGVNGHFLRRAARKRAGSHREAFAEAQARWQSEGRERFLGLHADA